MRHGILEHNEFHVLRQGSFSVKAHVLRSIKISQGRIDPTLAQGVHQKK